MIKKIDFLSKRISGEKVYFVVIVNRIAWYWDYKGERYGDFMDIKIGDLKFYTTELIKGAVKVLAEQAKESIKQIKCKKK
jgi:hypothetical protein